MMERALGPDIIYLHYDYQIRLIVIVYTVHKRSRSTSNLTGLYFPGLHLHSNEN